MATACNDHGEPPCSANSEVLGGYRHVVDPHLDEALVRLGIGTADWTVSEPRHNRWLTPGIWILARGDQRIVIKRLSRHRKPGPTALTQHWSRDVETPTRWNYWAREALAYETGLTQSYAATGLRGPQCLGSDVGRDDAVIAIEFIDGTAAEHWSISVYADAARALGAAQGRHADERSLEEPEWLSRDFLRTYSTEKPVPWELLDADEAWARPLVAENFPPPLRAAAVALHANRDRLYELVNSLPRALCHLDFWTKNLIQAVDGNFVLLDWGFIGVGALGEDIGNLVPDAAFDHFIEPERLPELRQAVFTGYLEGLRSAGWKGAPDLVDIAMAASAVKYDWLTVEMLMNASDDEHRTYGGGGSIDSATLYQRRGVALLDNAMQALRALDMADRATSLP